MITNKLKAEFYNKWFKNGLRTHFYRSYSNYNFECLKRDAQIDSGTTEDSVTLTLPYGFNDRWWRDGDTVTIEQIEENVKKICE